MTTPQVAIASKNLAAAVNQQAASKVAQKTQQHPILSKIKKRPLKILFL